MLELDEISLLAEVDTDFPVADLEEQLNRDGYTLNYFAPPDNRALLADALCRRLPNLFGAAFGGIDDLALQVKWAKTSGEILRNVATPRAAAGPSFKKLAIGAMDWLGLPIQARLRIFPLPESRSQIFAAFVREDGLEQFLHGLHRAGLALPLSAKIQASSAAECFVGVGLIETVWGGASWGNEEEIEARFEEVEAGILAKGGRILELKENSSEEDADRLLRDSALKDLKSRIEKAESHLSTAHLKLMARLKEAV
jgi:FAD/FMN-containing dehydrogenase